MERPERDFDETLEGLSKRVRKLEDEIRLGCPTCMTEVITWRHNERRERWERAIESLVGRVAALESMPMAHRHPAYDEALNRWKTEGVRDIGEGQSAVDEGAGRYGFLAYVYPYEICWKGMKKKAKCDGYFPLTVEIEGFVYKPGSWTIRREYHGPITAFDTLEHARKFLEPWAETDYLWLCVGKVSKESGVWKACRNEVGERITTGFPEGTRFYDKIMPVELVERIDSWAQAEKAPLLCYPGGKCAGV